MKTLSEAEWKLMTLIWSYNGSFYTPQILTDALARYQWSPSTVKTLLHRLVEKGYLTTEFSSSNRCFLYTVIAQEPSSMNDRADNVFNNFCNHWKGHVLYHLIQETPLTILDIESLQELLQHKKETAPTTIPCTCGTSHSCCCSTSCTDGGTHCEKDE